MSERVPITPEAKVADVLEAYPELEETLIAIAPMFAKLRNPVLRRTIARVTSLERAAAVAGIPPRELVVRLRTAAGLPVESGGEAPGAAEGEPLEEGPAPWVDPGRVQWTVDADQLLASDQEPIAEVLRRTATLTGDELGLIRSSFRPAPLIELLQSKGFRTAVVRSGEAYATFIGRRTGEETDQ